MAGKILIYGASGGIGSAIAHRLTKRGYSLHLAGRNTSKLAGLAAALDAEYSVGDVLDDGFFASVSQSAGQRLAGLIYAVGTINLKPLGRLTGDDFERDFKTNASGAAKAIQAALPALNQAEGVASIVLFSTVAVGQGFAGHASVAMAKGAVEGLTRALAAEFAPKIRVNAIAPSLIRTGLSAGITSNAKVAEAIGQMHALQRLGEPDDVASLAEYLVTADAGWITGQVIGVDGGRSSLRVRG